MKRSAAFLMLFLLVIGPFAHAQTDWQEFFPLHLGDYWVYEEKAPWPYIYAERVVGQDTMANAQIYANIQFNYWDYEGTFYRRVDSLGNVYDYDQFYKNEFLLYKLNVCVGDTWPDRIMGYMEVMEKNYFLVDNDTLTYLFIETFEDIAGGSYGILEKIGVTYYGFEGGHRSLLGALINGRLAYGDTTTTRIEQKDEIKPYETTLAQNYPNPFNMTTQINYYLKLGGDVKLEIYNIRGEMIKRLIDSAQRAGEHTVLWDGKDDAGNDAPSGVYFFRLNAENKMFSKSLCILR